VLALIAIFVLTFFALWAVVYRVLPAAWKKGAALWSAITRAILRRQRFAAWFERGRVRLRPLHPYRPLAAIVVVGFLTAGSTGAAFLGLSELLQEKSPELERIDHVVWRSARSHRSPGATLFFTAFTELGTVAGLSSIVLGSAAFLVTRGRHRWAAYLLVTAAGGWALNQSLKLLFARARPDMAEALRRSHGYAFPSGHAMVSLTVFGALVYLIMRGSWSWRMRSASIALALCLTAAISLSRIYLGVHWVSDIVAGVAAGMVWLATTTGTYEIFRRLRMLRHTSGQRSAADADLPPRQCAQA
jgi:undecaprenyl-diphosphatase